MHARARKASRLRPCRRCTPTRGAKSAACPVHEIRWCLVSGGVYLHKEVTKEEVASATMRGMRSTERGTGLHVTFAYDEDSFAKAAKVDGIPKSKL